MELIKVKGVLEEGGRRIVETMQDKLVSNGSLGSGKLARSIQDKLVENENGYELQISMLEYGKFVDEGIGRGPGRRPPVQPLIDWIKQRRIPIPSGMDIRSFAFIISNKIGRVGTHPRPRPFIQNSIQFVVDGYLTKELENAGAEDIDNIIQTLFEKNGGTI